ncbi:Hypothetical predicted protein [Marmota monax]|uniref:Uncharacterized protein n=1 Tax=Marmota monax TaxID=9995 RepID=A0A5E4B2R2_MARMO|nr:hypothetical protein GHT09_005444 [Marmota monax]VTJ63440.1 Hypothetical predicted protein [Marmota monax]
MAPKPRARGRRLSKGVGRAAARAGEGRCVTSVVRWRRRSHGGRRRRRRLFARLCWEAAVSGSHAPGPALALRDGAPSSPGSGLRTMGEQR